MCSTEFVTAISAPPSAHELPELEQMGPGVGRDDEAAARPQNARKLRERLIEVRHVVEHPGGDRDVELAVAKRKRLNVGDARRDTAFARQLDHARRKVDSDDLGSRVAADPFGELAPAAPDLQDPPGPCGDDGRDQRCSRIDRSRRAREGRRPPA